MSVKTMALVWDLDNEIIDREEKYVLLAYADHSDHDGRNMYPSIDLICKKTGYSERSIQTITRSLEEKGFLIEDGKGPKGTNKWIYGGGAEFAGVQKTGGGGAKVTVEGVQPTAPEPLTINKTSANFLKNKRKELASTSIEAAIYGGEPVTEEMAESSQLRDEAPKMFEKALGFTKPLPWWSGKEWDDFSDWVVEQFKQSRFAFGEYNIWRNTPYTKGGLANTRIRGFPAEFYDSWDMFKMSKQPAKETEMVRLL